MFREYEEQVVLPHISRERLRVAQVNDAVDNVPAYFHAVITPSRRMSQMKTLPDIDLLKEKRNKKIDQIKYAKRASSV